MTEKPPPNCTWVLVRGFVKAFIRVLNMNSNIFGVIGPGFLNQVPTFGGFILSYYDKETMLFAINPHLPRGSIYTTIMELGPKKPSL